MLHKILSILLDRPDDVCYRIRGEAYRNRDLYRAVCNVRGWLLDNCSRGDRVIVRGHKDFYMIASFLACSYAGMTYIPVDSSVPEERLKKIVASSRPALIIDESIMDVMNGPDRGDFSEVYIGDADAYYVIFTSGSTGEPKGVVITYSNLRSCVRWLEKLCGNDCGTVLNQANYSFDLSVADIYLPLVTGNTHYIIDRETQKDFPSLFRELGNSGAGLAVMTPSYADLLMTDRSFGKELMPNLRKILFCGEKLTENTAWKLFDRFPGIEIINSYGPTECTFAVTGTTVVPGEEISIGKPKDGVEIFLVDEKLEEVPDGAEGEILITGDSVGLGYLDKRQNENKFFTYRGRRAYLTGDLGYRRNGELFFAGRKDRQIKYKGYRIEISEIEKVLEGANGVGRCVVTACRGADGKVAGLRAFVKAEDGKTVTARELRDYLRRRLPDYMIPTIRTVDSIPLTENGKINEKELGTR